MKSKFIAAWAGVCAALSLALSAPAQAEDVFNFGLPTVGDAFFVAVAAAEDLGYYKAANLKVAVTAYRGGPGAQEALNAGAADAIGFFGAGAALAISRGAKSSIVASLGDKPFGWYMLASSKGGIQSMKDLDGKKVAVCARGGTADMLALWAADHAGVRVTAVPTGCAGMYTATKAGHTDAFASPPGASLKLIASGEMRPLMDLSDKMDPTYPNVIVASESATTRKAPQLRAFLAATFKALKYMQDNRAYGLKFLKAYSEETDDKANEQTYEAVTLNQSVTGAINKEWLKNSLRIAAKAWDMEELQKIDPASVYNDKFLPAVN